MTTHIPSIAGGLTSAEAEAVVTSTSGEWSTHVRRRVYYPYFRTRFRYATRTLLGTSGVGLSCLVDLRTGLPSTADPFAIEPVETDGGAVMAPRLAEDEALEIAHRYGAYVARGRRKALVAPTVTLLDQGVVYKPFWVVDGVDRQGTSFRILVDGITGAIHPLPAPTGGAAAAHSPPMA